MVDKGTRIAKNIDDVLIENRGSEYLTNQPSFEILSKLPSMLPVSEIMILH